MKRKLNLFFAFSFLKRKSSAQKSTKKSSAQKSTNGHTNCMPKKIAAICIVLFVCFTLGAQTKSAQTTKTSILKITPGFALDFGSLQDLFIKKDSYNVSMDLRCAVAVTESFELRTPIGFVWSKNNGLIADTGLFLTYYPFDEIGFFAGLSLMQFGFASKEKTLGKNVISLNEVLVGWTFNFRNGIFIEPMLSIRDPSGAFSNEYESIKDKFECYSTFRIKLNAGWKFDINQNDASS